MINRISDKLVLGIGLTSHPHTNRRDARSSVRKRRTSEWISVSYAHKLVKTPVHGSIAMGFEYANRPCVVWNWAPHWLLSACGRSNERPYRWDAVGAREVCALCVCKQMGPKTAALRLRTHQGTSLHLGCNYIVECRRLAVSVPHTPMTVYKGHAGNAHRRC